ncbi:hypothetical protein BY458DRAFT_426653, partial [Sporodiniella umbellata]
VTEMGLPVYNRGVLHLSGTFILNRSGCYECVSTVDSRPIFVEDGWEAEVAQQEGFNANSHIGGLEYRVQHRLEKPFFVMLQSHNKNLLPLCVGPIEIGLQEMLEVTTNEQENQQHRVIQTKNNKMFLIKEQWEKGTPGKVWDSAL